jgi:DNA-binding Xre family transcriptional regulator
MTAAEVARRIGGYRSNLSAMDAGKRSVSLRSLARISEVLGCSPGDLLEVSRRTEAPVFRQSRAEAGLRARDLGASDGTDKGWVHAVQIAWHRHYRTGRTRA